MVGKVTVGQVLHECMNEYTWCSWDALRHWRARCSDALHRDELADFIISARHILQQQQQPNTIACTNVTYVAFQASKLVNTLIILFRECYSRCRFQHITASSPASWNRFSPPSNFVNGHVSTMWFVVCRWPQSQEGDWARPHLCKLARHGP